MSATTIALNDAFFCDLIELIPAEYCIPQDDQEREQQALNSKFHKVGALGRRRRWRTPAIRAKGRRL